MTLVGIVGPSHHLQDLQDGVNPHLLQRLDYEPASDLRMRSPGGQHGQGQALSGPKSWNDLTQDFMSRRMRA